MEVVLTAVLVVLTGYQFVHPSVESGAYTAVVLDSKLYRMNTRDGTWEVCAPPAMKCLPTTSQTQNQTQNRTPNQ
jgi:hypothetical protein